MVHISESTFAERALQLFPPPDFLLMPSVGLDISDTSIRFMELEKTKNGMRLGKFGSHTITEELVVEGKIMDQDAFAKELKQVKKKYNLHFARVSLPEEHVYLFQTTIPSNIDNDEELRSTLEFQLEEHVPVPPREAIFDYEVIDVNGDETYVNIAVFSNVIVQSYVDVLEIADIVPLSFEVEAQALARSVIPDRKETYMIVDFGRKRTGIAIVSGGFLQFSTTVLVGGDTLTRAMKKLLELPEEEITKIKNEKGITQIGDNSELTASLMSTVSALKDEVSKHYTYWNTRAATRGTEGEIKKLILCGGSSNLAGLPEYLAFSIQAPVEIANVWVNVFSFDDVIPPIHRRKSLGYAAAIGLALRQ